MIMFVIHYYFLNLVFRRALAIREVVHVRVESVVSRISQYCSETSFCFTMIGSRHLCCQQIASREVTKKKTSRGSNDNYCVRVKNMIKFFWLCCPTCGLFKIVKINYDTTCTDTKFVHGNEISLFGAESEITPFLE